MSKSAVNWLARLGACRPSNAWRSCGPFSGTAKTQTDVHLPLLLWWAIESQAEAHRDAVLAMFEELVAFGACRLSSRTSCIG